MVVAVSFTKRLPPSAAKVGRGTLAELMAKQKRAVEGVSAAQEMQTPTIMQGFGKLANVAANAWTENRAQSDLDAQKARQQALMGQIDPLKGATPEQAAAMGEFDPDMMLKLWSDSSSRQRTLADMEQWEPYGEGLQRNIKTGEIKPQSSGGAVTNISTGDKIETEWGKKLAQKFGETVSADAAAGMNAATQLAQYDVLEQAMQGMLTGTEAGLAQWAKNNFGINLGGDAGARTQLFASIIDGLVPKQREEGSGTVSNYDAQMFKNSLPSFLGSAQGNTMLIGYLRGLAQYNQKLGQIAQQAQSIADPMQARQFYYEAAAKLGNPLATLQADLAKLPPPPDTADPANPADPDAPALPTGAVSQVVNPDGSITYTLKDGRKATVSPAQ